MEQGFFTQCNYCMQPLNLCKNLPACLQNVPNVDLNSKKKEKKENGFHYLSYKRNMYNIDQLNNFFSFSTWSEQQKQEHGKNNFNRDQNLKYFEEKFAALTTIQNEQSDLDSSQSKDCSLLDNLCQQTEGNQDELSFNQEQTQQQNEEIVNTTFLISYEQLLQKNNDSDSILFAPFEQTDDSPQMAQNYVQKQEERKFNYDANVELGDQSIKLGISLHRQGQYEEAINYYKKAERIYQQQFELFLNLGNALIDIQQYEEAIYMLDRAIQLHPNFAMNYYYKAYALTQLSCYSLAINSVNEVININPYYYDAYILKGEALIRSDDFEQALHCFNKAINLNPTADALQRKQKALELMHQQVDEIQNIGDGFDKILQD